MRIFFLLFLSFPVLAQVSLESVSKEMNKDLPEVYDSVTKLRRTTVENNNLIYHFLVDATQKENDWVMPKVKQQVLSNVCSNKRQRMVLQQLQGNLVYRYENTKGQSLGEFLIPSGYCSK